MPPLIVRMTGLDEFLDPNGDAWVKTLIIGPAGSGKTPFAAGFPKPFYIASEDGMMSVASKKLPFVRVKSSADFEAAVEYLANLGQRSADKRPYGTVVVDTVDTLQKLLIQERLKDQRHENMVGTDWNWLAGRMENYLHRLLNLPMNLVVNMHDKDYREDVGEETRIVKGNALKGDISTTIYGQFDLIGYLETYHEAVAGERQLKRHIRWHSGPKFPMLRDRSHQLPEFTDVDFTAEDYNRIHDAVFAAAAQLEKGVDVASIEVESDAGGEIAPPDMKGGPVADPSIPKAAPAKKTAAKAPKPEAATTGVEQPKEARPVTDESTSAKANAAASPAVEPPVSAARQKQDAEAVKAEKDAQDAAMKQRIADKRAAEAAAVTDDNATVDNPAQAAQRQAGEKLEAERQERIATRDEGNGKSSEQQLLETELGAVEIESEELRTDVATVPEGVERADQATGEISAETPEPIAPAEPAATGPLCGQPLPGMTPLAQGCQRPINDPSVSTVKLAIAQLRTKALVCDECFEKFKNA